MPWIPSAFPSKEAPKIPSDKQSPAGACKSVGDGLLNPKECRSLPHDMCYITYDMDFRFVSTDPVCFDKLSRSDE